MVPLLKATTVGGVPVEELIEKNSDRGGFAKNSKVYDRKKIIDVQIELSKINGTTVIIYDQTCAAEKRRRRKKGILEEPKKKVSQLQAIP